jgi:hypothetical protein
MRKFIKIRLFIEEKLEEIADRPKSTCQQEGAFIP